MGVPLNIDWQQILLHLFNFSILAGGLYLLLYKPVKNFAEKREAYFKDMDKNANEKLLDAEESQKKYKNKLLDIEAEAKAIKDAAIKDAEEAAKEHIKAAEEEKKRIIATAKETAEAEKTKIINEANKEIENIVSSAVDKLLASSEKNPYDDFLNSAEKE